jgi:hypothetical protein
VHLPATTKRLDRVEHDESALPQRLARPPHPRICGALAERDRASRGFRSWREGPVFASADDTAAQPLAGRGGHAVGVSRIDAIHSRRRVGIGSSQAPLQFSQTSARSNADFPRAVGHGSEPPSNDAANESNLPSEGLPRRSRF